LYLSSISLNEGKTMQHNKNHTHTTALTLDQLPTDILKHIAQMPLTPEDRARLYASNKSIGQQIKSLYLHDIRERFGINLPENEDVNIPDHDLRGINYVLTKESLRMMSYGELVYFNLDWDDPKQHKKNIFTMVKRGGLRCSIVRACKKDPKVAATCMRIPFLRERLPQAEFEIREPSKYTRFSGAILGFFVGVISKPVIAVWKILRLLFSIYLEMTRPLMLLAPVLLITLMSLEIISISFIMLLLVLPVILFVQDILTHNNAPFIEKLKRASVSTINLFSIIVMLPLNIFRCVIRGYQVGYKKVAQNLLKFVYWDEEQKALVSIWQEGYVDIYNSTDYSRLFLGWEQENVLVPISKWRSAIFPKAFSMLEVVHEIFNPTVAELAQVYEIEYPSVVDESAAREPMLGKTLGGVVAKLPDNKQQAQPKAEYKRESDSVTSSSGFFFPGSVSVAKAPEDSLQMPLLDSKSNFVYRSGD
jgi:hypothetical protein